jgi:hypothetical protein
MTQIQWQQLGIILSSMTADEKEQLSAMLVSAPTAGLSDADPLLGAMADEPELLDRVMENVYHARETRPWRVRD